MSESEIEVDLRRHVQFLHAKSKGWRYGIDRGDLFHDVVVKLERHNHPIPSRGKLFSLVSTTALHHLMDLSEKHSFRSAFFSKPMPTRLRPLPGSSMETVVSKVPSPAVQAALDDEVATIRLVAASDPKLEALFQALEELTGEGKSVSTNNVADHLDLPRKQVARSLQKLRSVAQKISDPRF